MIFRDYNRRTKSAVDPPRIGWDPPESANQSASAFAEVDSGGPLCLRQIKSATDCSHNPNSNPNPGLGLGLGLWLRLVTLTLTLRIKQIFKNKTKFY